MYIIYRYIRYYNIYYEGNKYNVAVGASLHYISICPCLFWCWLLLLTISLRWAPAKAGPSRPPAAESPLSLLLGHNDRGLERP